MVALGAVLSGFFIVATNAWMQHPVAYSIVGGRAELDQPVGPAHEPVRALAVPARDHRLAASPRRW